MGAAEKRETVEVDREDFDRLVTALEQIAQCWSRQLTSEDRKRERAARNTSNGPVPDHVKAKVDEMMRRRGK
jgi:hypothetical protein